MPTKGHALNWNEPLSLQPCYSTEEPTPIAASCLVAPIAIAGIISKIFGDVEAQDHFPPGRVAHGRDHLDVEGWPSGTTGRRRARLDVIRGRTPRVLPVGHDGPPQLHGVADRLVRQDGHAPRRGGS